MYKHCEHVKLHTNGYYHPLFLFISFRFIGELVFEYKMKKFKASIGLTIFKKKDEQRRLEHDVRSYLVILK